MNVAIAGGTGTIGREVARILADRGHEVRVLSRSAPVHRVDLLTGEGLDAALEGVDALVDASNQQSDAKGGTAMADASRRMLAAEAAAGVGHHVAVSIVGCDRVPLPYYRAKTAQERVVEDGSVPSTIVRATQFFDLLDMTFAGIARARVLPVPRAELQPIAAADAALAVADAVEAGPGRGRVEAAGPEIRDARDLAGAWRAARGRRAPVLPLPLPGALGRALRAGHLTTAAPDARGTTTFESWLSTATPR
ncbi:MAG TPA: NAD(P)H-binding protein [Capillimicrobium sp.]|jgi:uncharacterized protein YbjT (DUF2867 family)